MPCSSKAARSAGSSHTDCGESTRLRAMAMHVTIIVSCIQFHVLTGRRMPGASGPLAPSSWGGVSAFASRTDPKKPSRPGNPNLRCEIRRHNLLNSMPSCCWLRRNRNKRIDVVYTNELNLRTLVKDVCNVVLAACALPGKEQRKSLEAGQTVLWLGQYTIAGRHQCTITCASKSLMLCQARGSPSPPHCCATREYREHERTLHTYTRSSRARAVAGAQNPAALNYPVDRTGAYLATRSTSSDPFRCTGKNLHTAFAQCVG